MHDGADSGDSDIALGLIAGAGRFPAEAADLLRRDGHSVAVFGFEGITEADRASEPRTTKLGQLERLVELLRAGGCRRLLIVGRFSKTLLYAEDAAGVLAPDAAALAILSRAEDWQDAGLMGALSAWLEEQGFEICAQDEVLSPMIAKAGPLTSRSPDMQERADAALGRRVALALGRAGVGQAVSVRRRAVLALEAIEGTDEMIRRAGRLGGAGATIVKMARPGQDRRFDLPAIGPGTIEAMRDAGASALCVEAGSTLIVQQEEMRAAAEAAEIAVWGFDSAEPGA